MATSYGVSRLAAGGLCLAGILTGGCQTSPTQPAPIKVVEATDFQRDRQAILAMAGSYSVDFSFRETIAVRPDYALAEPYTSGGIEWITVLEDAGDRIVLQHVLVACETESDSADYNADDSAVTPIDIEADCFPIKHWRQDWVYQDQAMLEFRGNNRWHNVVLQPEQVLGTWSQAVYQVDDSPRYEGYGRWRHTGNQSVWQSEITWRPLPRREYTVRDDYDVLVAVNRHVITPNGWYHEQDNYKLDQRRDQNNPVIAREYGLNRYLPISAPELRLASEYMQDTQLFWAQVRDYWDHQLTHSKALSIASSVDDQAMYERMFELADEHRTANAATTPEIQREIRQALTAYVEPINDD